MKTAVTRPVAQGPASAHHQPLTLHPHTPAASVAECMPMSNPNPCSPLFHTLFALCFDRQLPFTSWFNATAYMFYLLDIGHWTLNTTLPFMNLCNSDKAVHEL